MCRLLAVVSAETTDFHFPLQRARRSLSALSREHPHGWGLAVHARGEGWSVTKDTACAASCERFEGTAASARGELLLAHVRRRTVGPTALENTHPFRQGPWVFAHNGTIGALEWMAARTSDERRSRIEGQTDSERFFAFILTVLDGVGAGDGSQGARMRRLDRALGSALAEARALPSLGPASFLLSDGEVLYVHRAGRALFALHRGVTATEPTPRREALTFASERMTDERWEEVPEGTLLSVETRGAPRWRAVDASI
jgi:predicted glutamine amidotransferase